MKKFIGSAFLTFALGLLAMVGPLTASTPDGSTPAEETVCDPLKADGITPGLYGLCVAFCEAQDHAALSTPITEAELEALGASAPAGRILENYNKKRDKANNGIDPEMPCIKVEEPCPCWTAEELATVGDNLTPTGLAVTETFCGNITYLIGSSQEYFQGYVTDFNNSGTWEVEQVYVDDFRADGGEPRYICTYYNDTPGDVTLRTLSVEAGTLTQDQWTSCKAEVQAKFQETKDAGRCTDIVEN